jgi:signal transduction histidine kinase
MILIEKMASDLANLTQNAFLLDQSIEFATVEERQRIASELHDSVTQLLFSASLLSELLPQRFHQDPEAALKTAGDLRRLTRGALAEMRTLLLELRPERIAKMPLGELLAQLTEAISSRTEVSIQVSVDNLPVLPADVQLAFYRIAQEALNNVVKHAAANQVILSLSPNPSFGLHTLENWHGEIKLVVKDNGTGFEPENLNYEHFGLGIMRERAAGIEAQFYLGSKPGKGTEVILIWQC